MRRRSGWFGAHDVGSGGRKSRWKGAAHSWKHSLLPGQNEVQLSPICIKHLSAQGWIHSESQQGAGDRAVGNILQAGKGAAARKPRGSGPVSRGLPTPSLVFITNIKRDTGKCRYVDSENLKGRTCVVTRQQPRKCSAPGWHRKTSLQFKPQGEGTGHPSTIAADSVSWCRPV